MRKTPINKKDRWLFTDWGMGLSSFKIYDSFDTRNLITERTIDQNGRTNWFNIDNIKREIEVYAKDNNVKIKGLNETIQDLRSTGFSYTDKTKEEYTKDANKRSTDRDKSNRFTTEIRIIE